ncbi:MAG: AAA family ATPase [Deltaproteobacteria bacterium]|nr:AAA family ATPase [Deltaproteobacteria bacterium]
MARIEGIRIRNYRALRDVTLGKLSSSPKGVQPLTDITAVIGRNGVGKSSLFDAFGFLADCLRVGVEEACDARGRGGFQRLRSQGSEGPIQFEIYYREGVNSRPISYELAIDLDGRGRAVVTRERLRQRRKGQKTGRPFSFLYLVAGQGVVWTGEMAASSEVERDLAALFAETPQETHPLWSELFSGFTATEAASTEEVRLSDPRRLGIATLGTLKQHERIVAFRTFIERWFLSYFAPNAARSLPAAGPQPHLSTSGENLSNVVQYLEREHPRRLQAILTRIGERIPGIGKIDTHRTEDGRLLLRFLDRGFSTPFYAQAMSDGTLKLFAYLLLLEDPDPAPFIGLEEPENGLYHKLLETLAHELRAHSQRPKGSQVFLTTHQPYLVNALEPAEVWVLEKGEDGFSTVRRASEDPVVSALVAEGLPLGALWYSDYLDED